MVAWVIVRVGITLNFCKLAFLSCGRLSPWRQTQEYSFTIDFGPAMDTNCVQ